MKFKAIIRKFAALVFRKPNGDDVELRPENKTDDADAEQIVIIPDTIDSNSDTLTLLNTSQTITNKTIDGNNNTISNLAHGAEVDNPSSGVHGVTGSVVGTSDAQTLTNKTINADLNTITNIENADIKAGAAIDYSKLNLTGSIVSGDLAGTIDAAKIHDGSVSNIEFGYLNGVTSAIQTQIDSKASSSALTTLDNAAAKTADAETVTGIWTFDEELICKHNATPSNPAAGYAAVYVKNDNKLYIKDSGGTETDVGASVGTATASSQGLVTSYVPTVQSSVHSVSSTNYTILDGDGYDTIVVSTGAIDRTITLPTASDNTGRKLTIKKTDSGLGRVLVTEEGTDQIDGFSQIVVPLIYDYVTVTCDGTTWHITDRLTTSQWFNTTPTGSMTTNTTYTGSYRRVGDSLQYNVFVSFAGAPNSVTFTLNLPNSWSIDTNKLPGATGNNMALPGAQACLEDAGTATYNMVVNYNSTTTVAVRPWDATGTYAIAGSQWSYNNIMNPIASGDELRLTFTVPISQFSDIA